MSSSPNSTVCFINAKSASVTGERDTSLVPWV